MAEIAGVALAVLPLVASAAENFRKVHRFFTRFRHFGPEVKEFQSELMIQRTIFRNECRLLIARVATQEDASDMLANISHPLWRDPSFSEKMSTYLGTSHEACSGNIVMIQRRLHAIEIEGEDLAQLMNYPETPRSTEDHSRRKRLAKKMKFAFSESSLDRNLSKIQDLNLSLRQITDNLSKFHELRPNDKNPADREQRKSIAKFSLIQRVSAHLYRALGRACTIHNNHAAHISLDPILAEGSDPQVCFSVSFCPIKSFAINGTARPGDLVWLSIESIVKTSMNATPSDLESSTPGTGQASERDNGANLRNVGSVHEQVRAVRFEELQGPSMMLAVQSARATRQYLGPNFCTRIKSYSRPLDTSRTCLGHLDDNSDFEHLVYVPSQPFVDDQKPIRSLESLFRHDTSSLIGIPMYEKFRYSRLLATALLQFHATPWLENTWRSRDIFLFSSLTSADNIDVARNRLEIASLYTNVPVRGANDSSNHDSDKSNLSFAPNRFLFNLGVIMIEIAFEAPLQSMRKSVDFDQCSDDRHIDFFTARRLNDTTLASTEMGLRFSDVVRKCIHCDFGRGHDLNKPELQEGVYREVICELSRLETKLREVQLGI